MAQNENMQVRYASLVEAKLRAESVVEKLFNNRYEGDPVAGAVKVPVRTDATVGSYSIANGGSLSAPATSYVTIVCDKDLYVNELIDGYMAAAVPDGLVADRLESAAFALANDIDVKLIAALVAGGTVTSHAKYTKTDIYDAIVDDVAAAKAAKVNPRSMWLLVSNETYATLIKSSQFIEATGNLAELEAGAVGMIAGIPVYESANLTSAQYILGNSDFCHFVGEWSVPVAVNDLSDGTHIGCSAVQGRKACGYTISKQATVIVKTVTGE